MIILNGLKVSGLDLVWLRLTTGRKEERLGKARLNIRRLFEIMDWMIKASHRLGIGFGTTSGVITTLGVIVGLDSASGSRLLVAGGIITIAFADAFSDS